MQEEPDPALRQVGRGIDDEQRAAVEHHLPGQGDVDDRRQRQPPPHLVVDELHDERYVLFASVTQREVAAVERAGEHRREDLAAVVSGVWPTRRS